MTLLLLLFGGFWTQVMSNPEGLQNTTMSLSTLHTEVPGTQVMSSPEGLQNSTMSPSILHTEVPSISEVPSIPEASAVYSTVSTRPETSGPTSDSTSTFPNPLWTSTGDIINTPVPEPATSREVSNKTPVQLSEPTAVSSDPSTTTANPVTGRAVSFTSQETFQGISELPDTMTTSSKETSEPSVAITVSSKPSGPPVTMTTESLGLSSEPHGLPTTLTTSSVESSSAAGGTPVSNIKISTMSTPEPVTTRTPHKGSSGMLLVPMLVALLVVLALVALLLLWRRRQKRRTGALTLSGGGKRNGVVDAWAGPARVPDEEAATAAASGSGGNKGSAALEREGSGQRPTLTTFFSRRKSRQGSLVLEELKPGPAPDLKGEEEPLVGGEDEAVETPTSDGLEAKDGAVPQSM
ncbi:LOW QUALITY PROTEIN: leukosialin [Microtus oregoni]|uniref:LOW QUALITY PROTEIN: leukosialin n=1 Tax=Microtus oregoni TaxID=111838 RepID=UPI001BB1CCAB|nr:LOW QUALITY PROTEIN: leukosialin [Microtus oregoni]